MFNIKNEMASLYVLVLRYFALLMLISYHGMSMQILPSTIIRTLCPQPRFNQLNYTNNYSKTTFLREIITR